MPRITPRNDDEDRQETPGPSMWGIGKWIASGVLGFLVFIIFLMTYFTVDQNEVKVVTNWGEFSYVAEPGLHFKMPFRTNTFSFPTDLQHLDNNGENAGKGANTFSFDNQEVDVKWEVVYTLDPSPKCIENMYAHNQGYKANMQTLVNDRLKAAMGNINTQVVASERGKLRDEIRITLKQDVPVFIGCVLVSDFRLNDMQFTPQYREAINKAAVQKANVETREYARQEAVKEAERVKAEAIGVADKNREEARGNADARMLNAKALADALLLQKDAEAKGIKLTGDATAAAISAQQEALKANTALIELERVKHWNGALPQNIYAGAPVPFFNMPVQAPAK